MRDNVPFKDRARFQFLLHFWPYAAQVYVPATHNNEGERTFVGFALAIPDVANLELFCEEFPQVLRARGVELYRSTVFWTLSGLKSGCLSQGTLLLMSRLGRCFVSMPANQPGLIVLPLKRMQRQAEFFHGIKGCEP